MDTKDLSNERTAPPDSKEVAGILMAISVVAKRLAKNILLLDQKENEQKEDDTNGKCETK